MMDRQTCETARLARDARFDGLFSVGVLSTGIFCRCICAAKHAHAQNVVYYPSAAAAIGAGLRPCRRCHPESAPALPWGSGMPAVVARALGLIRQGVPLPGDEERLLQQLGINGKQMRHLFRIHLGASPQAVVAARQVLLAGKLIAETCLPLAHVATACGFADTQSLRDAYQAVWRKDPADEHRERPRPDNPGSPGVRCRLTLAYRPPYHWEGMLSFLQHRAIPGIEGVRDGVYRRTIAVNGTQGTLAVRHAASGNALELDLALTHSGGLMEIVERVRRMFGLDADMRSVYDTLARDPLLQPRLARSAGLRLPVAWDPFELAMRAVVGQQVTVKAAGTLAGRIVERVGRRYERSGHPELTHLFPSAREIAAMDGDRLGMPRKRVDTLRNLARTVAEGRMRLAVTAGLPDLIRQLTRLPGIGEWTAHYIAMRGLGEPDAFPADDLGIIRALQSGTQRPSKKQVLQVAEKWRPWRAYAAIYLWHG